MAFTGKLIITDDSVQLSFFYDLVPFIGETIKWKNIKYVSYDAWGNYRLSYYSEKCSKDGELFLSVFSKKSMIEIETTLSKKMTINLKIKLLCLLPYN
jgi:predicted HicB family RNase H-like nuclease